MTSRLIALTVLSLSVFNAPNAHAQSDPPAFEEERHRAVADILAEFNKATVFRVQAMLKPYNLPYTPPAINCLTTNWLRFDPAAQRAWYYPLADHSQPIAPYRPVGSARVLCGGP